jgi:hypothetical protein
VIGWFVAAAVGARGVRGRGVRAPRAQGSRPGRRPRRAGPVSGRVRDLEPRRRRRRLPRRRRLSARRAAARPRRRRRRRSARQHGPVSVGTPKTWTRSRDTDGCPDPDNDADGVPDTTDRCPNEPRGAARLGPPAAARPPARRPLPRRRRHPRPPRSPPTPDRACRRSTAAWPTGARHPRGRRGWWSASRTTPSSPTSPTPAATPRRSRRSSRTPAASRSIAVRTVSSGSVEVLRQALDQAGKSVRAGWHGVGVLRRPRRRVAVDRGAGVARRRTSAPTPSRSTPARCPSGRSSGWPRRAVGRALLVLDTCYAGTGPRRAAPPPGSAVRGAGVRRRLGRGGRAVDGLGPGRALWAAGRGLARGVHVPGRGCAPGVGRRRARRGDRRRGHRGRGPAPSWGARCAPSGSTISTRPGWGPAGDVVLSTATEPAPPGLR